MFGLEKLFKPKTDYKLLVKNGAVIIDVRTPAEFAAGHIPGSRNICLDKIPAAITVLKKIASPLITCCQSGARSAIANRLIKGAGIESYNGGGWSALQKKLS